MPENGKYPPKPKGNKKTAFKTVTSKAAKAQKYNIKRAEKESSRQKFCKDGWRYDKLKKKCIKIKTPKTPDGDGGGKRIGTPVGPGNPRY